MKISSKNIIIFIIFSLLIFTTNSYGNTSSEFINNIAEKASKILSSKETNDLKIQQLTKIAKDSSDIDGIGLYMLGKHRKKLNEEQKNEYKEIFRTYFLKYFSNTLVEYKEARIVVISEEVKNEKYTIVNSKLLATSNRPEISIDWRVYTKDTTKPLIRDLVIEGVSLARAQKEEFNSIIANNNGDVNALIKNLKEFNNR